jgi:hypothetical protein
MGMKRMLFFGGVILVGTAIIFAEFSSGSSVGVVDRFLPYILFGGGMALILVSGLCDRRSKVAGFSVRMKPGRIVVILLGVVIAIQLVVAYYYGEASAPFSLQVTPLHVNDGIVGEKYAFNVTVKEEGEGRHYGEPVMISVFAPDAEVEIDTLHVIPEGIARITVIPTEASMGRNLIIIIYGRRSKRRKAKATISVINPDDIS